MDTPPPRAIYNLFSKFQQLYLPFSHKIIFWLPGNWLAFTRVCSIPQHVIIIFGIFCWFLAFTSIFWLKKHPLGEKCLLNVHHKKKDVKLGAVTHRIITTIYNCNSRLSCSRNLRTSSIWNIHDSK